MAGRAGGCLERHLGAAQAGSASRVRAGAANRIDRQAGARGQGQDEASDDHRDRGRRIAGGACRGCAVGRAADCRDHGSDAAATGFDPTRCRLLDRRLRRPGRDDHAAGDDGAVHRALFRPGPGYRHARQPGREGERNSPTAQYQRQGGHRPGRNDVSRWPRRRLPDQHRTSPCQPAMPTSQVRRKSASRRRSPAQSGIAIPEHSPARSQAIPGVYFGNPGTAISGGTDVLIKVVTDQDLANARDAAIASMNQSAQSFQLPDGRIVIPSTVQTAGDPSVQTDHTAGEQVDSVQRHRTGDVSGADDQSRRFARADAGRTSEPARHANSIRIHPDRRPDRLRRVLSSRQPVRG